MKIDVFYERETITVNEVKNSSLHLYVCSVFYCCNLRELKMNDDQTKASRR
jgi:hypothetical protein